MAATLDLFAPREPAGFPVSDAAIVGNYRYRLRRLWSPAPPLVWIMLNPSLADATTDDAVRRALSPPVPLHRILLTKRGNPCHPLRKSLDLPLVRWP